jgi:hypothetical protein
MCTTQQAPNDDAGMNEVVRAWHVPASTRNAVASGHSAGNQRSQLTAQRGAVRGAGGSDKLVQVYGFKHVR